MYSLIHKCHHYNSSSHSCTSRQTNRQTAERAARVSADAQSSPDRILKSSDVTRLIHDPISILMESSGCRWEVAAECKTFKTYLNHSYQKLCIYLTLCRFKDLSSTLIFSDCHHMIQMNPVLELTSPNFDSNISSTWDVPLLLYCHGCHPHLVPRSRMSRCYISVPLSACMSVARQL
jgi:hypothetical protein